MAAFDKWLESRKLQEAGFDGRLGPPGHGPGMVPGANLPGGDKPLTPGSGGGLLGRPKTDHTQHMQLTLQQLHRALDTAGQIVVQSLNRGMSIEQARQEMLKIDRMDEPIADWILQEFSRGQSR